MKIVLPIGPTDNRRHIVAWRMHRIIDSTEYRTWKEEALWKIKGQLPKGFKTIEPRFEQQLVYRIKVFMPNKRTDHTNYLKGVQDTLKLAKVFKDDKWVVPHFEWCEIDKLNPRIEVTI